MTTTEATGAPAPAAPSKGADVPLLELRKISKSFGAVQALRDVDLALYSGEVTALTGDNGAGKSVLIKTIAGIHGPDRGDILWKGRPVHIRSPTGRRRVGHRDRVPGPRAVRQPRHRAEHVPRARAHAPRPADGGGHGAVGAPDAGRPLGDDRALDPPAGRLAVGRPAPGGRGGEGGDVELRARDHGRAHRRARRRPDRDGPRPRPSARRPRPGGSDGVAQPQRRVRSVRPYRGAAPRPDGRRRPRERLRPTDRSSTT